MLKTTKPGNGGSPVQDNTLRIVSSLNTQEANAARESACEGLVEYSHVETGSV